MAVINGLVCISLGFFILYIVGVMNYLKTYEDNKCEMTYMFEYPQYVRISLPFNVTVRYRRYGLFAYSEGRFTERAREMKFNGIPVLFIPGNSGSLKQVRSLASVSLRKALGSHSSFHFDFFSADLNEEYMGLFGGFLTDQTRFASHCVDRIFSLYKYNRPESIILIGHSMGGVIAKGLFLEPDFDANRVRLLITLATPHSPALIMDPYMADYYQRLATLPSIKDSVTLVSVGGGLRDVLIRSSLTHATDAFISVTSTQVPDAWLSTDHLSIMWCKQLVLVLTRALFDSVDPRTGQVSADARHREAVFDYHLLNRSAGKDLDTSRHADKVMLWDGLGRTGMWRETLQRQFTASYPTGVADVTHHMVRLADLPSSAVLDMLAVNHKGKDWIYACKADALVEGVRLCTWGDNLSGRGRIAPSKQQKRKTARLDVARLRQAGHTHVVVRLLATNQPVKMHFDVHGAEERVLNPQSLPRWMSFATTTLIKETSPKALDYTVVLPGLTAIWQAYRLWVQTVNCSEPDHQAVASLTIPWSNDGSSKVILHDKDYLPIFLHSARPGLHSPHPDPFVRLTLDPACTYSLKIESWMPLSLGQLARSYTPLLLPSIASVLLLTLRHQLHSLATTHRCPLFMTAVVKGAKPYYLLPAAKILSHVGRTRLFAYLSPSSWSTLQESGIDFMFLPIMLYAVGLAIVYIVGASTYVGIVASGQAVNKIVLRFVGHLIPGWSDWVLTGLGKVPVAVAVFMVALCYTASGGLALAVGAVFYFLKVCSLYEDYLEQLMLWPVKLLKRELLSRIGRGGGGSQRQVEGKEEEEKKKKALEGKGNSFEELQEMFDLTEINYHITVMLIWSVATLVHIPSVLVWAHNYRYNSKLEPDPALWSAALLSACAGLLWQGNMPRTDLVYYKELGMVMYALACAVLAFTQISLYRAGHVLTAAVVLLTLHHLVAPWLTPAAQPEDEEEDEEPVLPPTLTESSTPDDEEERDCRALAETLTSITERTEEVTDDPTGSNNSESEEKDGIEIVLEERSEFDKLTPTSDSDLELCSSNASVSSFENISSAELTKNSEGNEKP